MAMTLLPRFLVLYCGGNYITVPENLHESLPSGFLKFDEEQIWSPRVKFAVEQAKTGDGRFVHIRSCYNNKYWVADPLQQLLWIVAAGDKPEEDQSNDKCTLFEPFTSSQNESVGLRHVQTGKTLIYKSPEPFPQEMEPFVPSWMFRGVEVSESHSDPRTGEFYITDWGTLVILPSQISFRSKKLNGNYLCSHDLDGGLFNPNHPYQTFEYGLEEGDTRVAKVPVPTRDGNYRIKDAHSGKFWRGSPNWIWADVDSTSFYDYNNYNTRFSIVKISDNVIALRNVNNNKFCGPVSDDDKTNCLKADFDYLETKTMLMVEEFGVLKREISDVRYRLSDSRIYNDEIQDVSHAFATNYKTEDADKQTLTYKTSDSTTTHWANSVSFTLDLSVKFAASIPCINSGEVKLSAGFAYSHEWGVSKKTERVTEASYVVRVPPLKKIKVTLKCTKGSCDVPFSYIQRDLLTTGKWVTTIKDDGIYTGSNSYDFFFESSEVTVDAQGRMTESILESTPTTCTFNQYDILGGKEDLLKNITLADLIKI